MKDRGTDGKPVGDLAHSVIRGRRRPRSRAHRAARRPSAGEADALLCGDALRLRRRNGKDLVGDAGALPAGLTLSNDGHLSGTPTAPGSYSFTATVSDGASSSSKGLSLTIIPGITVNATPTVPTAEVRTSYSASVPTMLGVTGGVPPYRYAPVSGFPFGIGFDSPTGQIFGSPREPGVVNLTIAITDANGATKQVTVSVTVVPKLHIESTRLARGIVGKRYRANVSVAGGQDPVWALLSGKLPAGLKLNSTTGAITGLPKRAGSFHFTVSVKDALGATVSIRYALVIRNK